MILRGCGIDIEGTKVIVKIVKAKEQPEIIDNYAYCDIVAKKSGVISKIIAQNGMAQVNVGDTVKNGDILIKGIMEGKYTEPRKVHSLGIVEAEVIYSKTKEFPIENNNVEETINLASEELSSILDKELEGKGEIIDKQIKTTQNENSVVVTLNYKIVEEIGENKLIN